MSSIYEKMLLGFQDETKLPLLAEDENWRVRYSAAVAMGESRDPKYIPCLEKMFLEEEKRSLYSQPRADEEGFARIPEKIGPLKDPFADSDYTEEQKENWKCRGRVKVAIADAMRKIGKVSPVLEESFKACLVRDEEDYSVKCAITKALAEAGGPEWIETLKEVAKFDEWCAMTEAKKAIRKIEKRGMQS